MTAAAEGESIGSESSGRLRPTVWRFLTSTRTTAVVGLLSAVAILISGAKFLLETGERDRLRILAAWQVLAASEGSRGEGGRRESLAELTRAKINLSGIKIDSTEFEELNLTGARLAAASFRGSRLTNPSLVRAHFDSADLSNVTVRARREDCRSVGLRGLDSARFVATRLSGAAFHDVHARDMYVNGVRSSGVVFDNVCFNGTDFNNSSLSAKFDNSSLVRVTFTSTSVTGDQSSFRRTVLDSADFRVDGIFAHTSFRLVWGRGTKFREGVVLDSADFSESCVEQGTFANVHAVGAIFSKAVLDSVVFVDVDLRNASFRDAQLRHVSFERVRLEGADFAGVVGEEVTLSNSTTDDARLSARLSGTSGFDRSRCVREPTKR